MSSSSPSSLSLTLKIVSMNIADCIPSQEAPIDWTMNNHKQALVQELLKNDPDIIALQEFPGNTLQVAEDEFGQPFGYKAMGITPAHAGYVVLFVRKEIIESKYYSISTVVRAPNKHNNNYIPAVMIRIQYRQLQDQQSHMRKPTNNSKNHYGNATDDHILYVASCHLQPFQGGFLQRKQQMEQLVQMAGEHHAQSVKSSSCLSSELSTTTTSDIGEDDGVVAIIPPLIIAGDTNMRDTEDENIEQGCSNTNDTTTTTTTTMTVTTTSAVYNYYGGFLYDAWKVNGSDPAKKFTWDTMDHTDTESTMTTTITAPPVTTRGVGVGGERRNGGSFFNRFYGRNTRQYTARYDRIYIYPGKQQQNCNNAHLMNPTTTAPPPSAPYNIPTAISDSNGSKFANCSTYTPLAQIIVPSFELIANKPIPPSKYHFLSDHFGLSATISFFWIKK